MQPSGMVVPGLWPPLSSLLPPLLCVTHPGPTGPPRGAEASRHPQLSCFLHLCLWPQPRDHPPHCPLVSLEAPAAVSAPGTADWTQGPATSAPCSGADQPSDEPCPSQNCLGCPRSPEAPTQSSLLSHSFTHPPAGSFIQSLCICSFRDNATYVHFMSLPR